MRPKLPLLLLAVLVPSLRGQTLKPHAPEPVPVPKLYQAAPAPTDPPAQTVEDGRTHLSLRLPAGWNLSRRDGEISTFHLDARSAPRRSELRLAANLAFNPYPYSTFSGALFYLSVTPKSTMAACTAQTSMKPEKLLAPMTVGDVSFTRGLDEHGHICTEARDVTYAALRQGSCLRFDLVVNTFCGGEVSGAKDMTDQELARVFRRLEGILETVEFKRSGAVDRE